MASFNLDSNTKFEDSAFESNPDVEQEASLEMDGNQIEFGQFVAIGLIGEAKAKIYKVFSTNNNQIYALKVFDLAEDDSMLCHYENEIRFTQLDHPNILKISDSQEYEDLIQLENDANFGCLLVEYCPKGDFYELICNKVDRLPEIIVRTYFHQLISAIEYLHFNQIAHMDIKLENLLLDDDYQLKLCDFDLSILIGEQVELKGTQNYRAPELKSGNCQTPKAADIYAAGIVLFILKSGGVHPHLEETNLDDGTNLYSLLYRNLKKFWKTQAKICEVDIDFFSPEFQDLFLSMVEMDPKKRATIQDIKNSAWYSRDVLTPTQLKAAMESQFKIVDQ